MIRAYLREVDVGNDDDVDGAGSILGLSAGITAGVVAVLAIGGTSLPGHAGLGDRLLGCGCGGSTACVSIS